MPGGFSGTNITVPEHQYFTGSLIGTGDADWYDINIANTSYPIAVTLIMDDGVDFDVAFYDSDSDPLFSCSGPPQSTAPCVCIGDSDGTCKSRSVRRQETLGYQPPTVGIYKIKVESYSGGGNYFFDQSAGTAPVAVAISIIANDNFDYGTLPLSPSSGNPTKKSTIDLNATPVIKNTGGAAVDLDIKSSDATGGTTDWNLVTAASIGTNAYCHQYSTTAPATWVDFPTPADDIYDLDIITNLAPSATTTLDLQILMPIGSGDFAEKTIIVTIRASGS